MFKYVGNTSDLKRSLSALGRIIQKTNTVPILGNVMLSERNGMLAMMGTDLSVSMETAAPAEVISGSATIPYHKLTSFINVLDDDHISIEVNKDVSIAVCKGGDAISKIPTLPVEDMPTEIFERLTVPKNRTKELGADFVRDTLKTMAYACKSEKARVYLLGAHFDGTNKAIVATDGKIMAVEHFGGKFDGSFTLPSNSFDAVISICGDGDCEIKASDNAVSFETKTGFARTRMLDGTYPDYSRLIQHQNRILATVSHEELARVVSQGSLAYSSKSSACVVIINDDGITIEKDGDDGAKSQSRCHADVHNHAKFGMDPSYLIWAANSFADHKERVDILSDGDNSPIFVRPEADENSLRLLMPMRI